MEKNVMLGQDLKLGSHLQGVIESLIQAGGGHMTSNVEDAHMLVCKYRSGSDYVKASQAKKDVGNLSWLYYMVAHKVWTNPMRRMMHYPVPPDGIPGFKSYTISISSYTGEARVYLENLIKAIGAEFTKTFRQDNTHLITAHTRSDKFDAAKEWNVNIVNHLWLEESYSKCKEQTLTDGRYTHFPLQTNLGEILGQTQIDRAAAEKAFFMPSAKPEKSANGSVSRTSVPGSSGPSVVIPQKPVGKAPVVQQKVKEKRTKSDPAAPAGTPALQQVEDKENKTPSTTGSRGAKDRALSRLHDAAPDIAKFEKEMKRKGGVVHGGKRHPSAEADSAASRPCESTGSKRARVDADDDEKESSDKEQEETKRKSKRQKSAKEKAPIKYRVVISKDSRWVENPKSEASDKVSPRPVCQQLAHPFAGKASQPGSAGDRRLPQRKHDLRSERRPYQKVRRRNRSRTLDCLKLLHR